MIGIVFGAHQALIIYVERRLRLQSRLPAIKTYFSLRQMSGVPCHRMPMSIKTVSRFAEVELTYEPIKFALKSTQKLQRSKANSASSQFLSVRIMTDCGRSRGRASMPAG